MTIESFLASFIGVLFGMLGCYILFEKEIKAGQWALEYYDGDIPK